MNRCILPLSLRDVSLRDNGACTMPCLLPLPRLLLGLLCAAAALCSPRFVPAAEQPNQTVDFTRDIQPLLKQHCTDCHQTADPQSGLALDSPLGIRRGGDHGAVFKPGVSGQSLLLKVLQGDGEIPRMPLDQPPLSAQQIELLQRWIDAGAPLPADDGSARRRSDHWAFQPVVRPPLPETAGDPWVRNAIDAFILQRQLAAGLDPSPRADNSTLARRAALDVTGLLPDSADFNSLSTPAGYGRYIDRLLASPRYGERWGRHWLDAARYADSNGFTIDSGRDIWKYREWVIAAFNRNLPFDQFTIEQLAGDLLPDPRMDQLVATGFHRNTLINEEGGTDQEQFRIEAVVDRVNTTGTVFLGLTIACAQCHSHKYDPFTQREYYQLFAFFNNTDEYSNATRKYPVPAPEQAADQQRLQRELQLRREALQRFDAQHLDALPAWAAEIAAIPAPAWDIMPPEKLSSDQGSQLNRQDDDSIFVDFSIPPNDVYRVTGQPASGWTALRLEALTHDSLPERGPGRADNGNFVLSELRAAIIAADGSSTPVKLTRAYADHSQSGYNVAAAIDGKSETGWAIKTDSGSLNVDREAVFLTPQPVDMPAGSRLQLELEHSHRQPKYMLGRFRLATTGATPEQLGMSQTIVAIAARADSERTDEERQQLRAAFLGTLPERQPIVDRVTAAEKELDELTRQIPTTYITRELPQPRDTHIHIRGDFLRPGALVAPEVPEVLPPLPATDATVNRLTLARWLVSPDNPLTARVAVNRLWQRYFGTGLVETENDFGAQGSLPTHPQLLDWLAAEFMDSGWNLKHIHRLILTSATYQQSSRHRPELMQVDARNRLLTRQNRVRLEAETIRDVFLSASGLLTEQLGGPSFYPPQPDGIYVLTQTRKAWPESTGPERYRRGMYIQFWRSSPYPFLPTFDAPNATTTCTRRSRSNTPLQALTLANDQTFMELIRGLAVRLLEQPGSDASRLQQAFQVCLARVPTDQEEARLGEFLDVQRAYFEAHPEEAQQLVGTLPMDGVAAAEQATWIGLARVITNLDEFITRE